MYFSSPTVCNGTFLELGALDGVLFSNTKFFEDTLQWKGVLIEANPNNYRLLSRGDRRPKSNKFYGAVCPSEQKNITMSFRDTRSPLATGGDVSRMIQRYKDNFIGKGQKDVVVPCRPLSAYIHEAGIKHIDLLSLDVEGSEPLVLSTMDWSIPVNVFLIEYNENTREAINRTLTEHGYVPATFNLSNLCLPGRACTSNLVFVNKRYGYGFQ